MEGQFYLNVVRRWWWLLLIGPILAGASAFYYSKQLTPIYRTSSTLLINQTQNPGVLQYNDVLASERLTNTYAQLVTRQVVLDEVIKRLGLKVSEPQLASRISVSAISNTQLLRVTVDDANPSVAAQIANTTAQAFIDDNTSSLGRPGTVTIAESANAPASPAKPNVKLNTILAAFLGLLVVGGIAVALEYLDDTIKGGEETEEHFGLPTLGVVRRIKNLMETGGPATHTDASEAYIQLRTNVHFFQPGVGKLVAGLLQLGFQGLDLGPIGIPLRLILVKLGLADVAVLIETLVPLVTVLGVLIGRPGAGQGALGIFDGKFVIMLIEPGQNPALLHLLPHRYGYLLDLAAHPEGQGSFLAGPDCPAEGTLQPFVRRPHRDHLDRADDLLLDDRFLLPAAKRGQGNRRCYHQISHDKPFHSDLLNKLAR